MPEYVDICGIRIRNSGYEDIIETIDEKLKAKERYSFLYINQYVFLKADSDRIYRNYLKYFSDLYADGLGIYLASKITSPSNPLKERITGTDLYYKILSFADLNKLRVFFFGGGEEAADCIEEQIKMLYPNIVISGIIKRETVFKAESVRIINSSNSDILFLGLGTPYQEEWISKYSNTLNVPIQIAVGSGIEFLSGHYKRAPEFMRKIGLEWLYRLIKEPGRLWKRYIIGIPIFILKVLYCRFKLLLKFFK